MPTTPYYHRKDEFVDTSAGAADAGKPVKLDSGGKIGATQILASDIDHGGLTGLGDDDHSKYPLADGTRGFTGEVAGVTPTVGASLATKDYVDGKAVLPYGKMRVDTPGAVTLTVLSTFYKAAGTWALGLSNGVDMPASNRLRYTGATSRKFLVIVSMSMISDTNSNTLLFQLYKYDSSAGTGALEATSEQQRKIGTGADVGNAGMVHMVTLDQNDYLELHIATSNQAGSTVTLNKAVFTMHAME